MSDTPTEMSVEIDYGDGSPPETLTITDGFTSFHAYPDDQKYEVTVTEVGADQGPAPEEPEAQSAPEPEPEAPADEFDPNAPDQTWTADAAFDPAAHTVTEVIGYVEDNPDQREAVLELEREGKDRVTLVTHLEGMA